MRSIINELWHGNITPQEDSRNMYLTLTYQSNSKATYLSISLLPDLYFYGHFFNALATVFGIKNNAISL